MNVNIKSYSKTKQNNKIKDKNIIKETKNNEVKYN